MSTKKLIYYGTVTIKFTIPPGWIVELPLKDTCINSPFLNISTVNYTFEPCTKYHFIGLTTYLPDLILNTYKINLDSNDEKTLFQDYKYIYDGIYNNLIYNEGFITPGFYKYKSEYFSDIANIWEKLYDLISTILKNYKGIEFITEIINSPAQSIWFSCLFYELENVFFENGLFDENTVFSKKIWANEAVKNINNKLNKILESVEPIFLTSTIPDNLKSKTCNKSYVLAIAEKIAISNDETYKKLKEYYQLEKRFFKKYRDNKNFQIGYINNCGTYIRGKIGRNTHNL